MKKFYPPKRTLYMFALFSISVVTLNAQNIVNNGNGIVINQGAWLMVGGNYINQTAGQDGFIDIDGKMVVNRDFINNAGNETFASIEAVPDGEVILNGSAIQNIAGTQSTRFENLTIQNNKKMLQTDLCQVAGKLKVQAILDLNSFNFVIDNPSTNAITYVSGYIYSETLPADGLGIIIWSIGASAGTYAIPFGSGHVAHNDLNLTLQLSSAGSADGVFLFSTYPSSFLNTPFPNGIPSLSPFDVQQTADRYWLVNPQYTSIPSASIEFMYDNLSVNGMNESTLKAIRFNPSSAMWNDWGPDGVPNVNQNTVTTSIIPAVHFHPWWTLAGEELAEYIYVPNAFSPNADGSNDEFKPLISGYEPDNYTMYVFNRWGEKIFESSDLNNGWDGTFNNIESPQDVYVWMIIFDDMNKKSQSRNGIVTLIR